MGRKCGDQGRHRDGADICVEAILLSKFVLQAMMKVIGISGAWRPSAQKACRQKTQAIRDRNKEPNSDGFHGDTPLRVGKHRQYPQHKGHAVADAISEKELAVEIEGKHDEAQEKED